ncbi:MAG: DUF1987 domain-containing protein [Bacteroidetes bacterium]|nr:DUF1987 domain-containing protein [Bacteroidota bacterium]
MKTLIINGTDDTPKVVLDTEKDVFEISGRSLPEDVVTFFQPVIDWLHELEKDPLNEMEFDIKLEYFNTASSKQILDIFLILDDIFLAGNSVKVNWYYSELDEDLGEAGEEYSELVEIPFNLIAMSEENSVA